MTLADADAAAEVGLLNGAFGHAWALTVQSLGSELEYPKDKVPRRQDMDVLQKEMSFFKNKQIKKE